MFVFTVSHEVTSDGKKYVTRQVENAESIDWMSDMAVIFNFNIFDYYRFELLASYNPMCNNIHQYLGMVGYTYGNLKDNP